MQKCKINVEDGKLTRRTPRLNGSVCVLAVYNKAQAQIISNREFKLWTFLQGTESRVATFLAETCVMSHQSRYELIRYR